MNMHYSGTDPPSSKQQKLIEACRGTGSTVFFFFFLLASPVDGHVSYPHPDEISHGPRVFHGS